MRTRNHSGILLLAACIIFAVPAAGHADNLFRLFPEASLSGLYGDQINNKGGDFAGTLVAGFYLDYTSAARYASLHYDTFAQLFAHNSQYDRAGEGQFVRATDEENLSPTTHLRLDELYFRNSPTVAGIATSNQGPELNAVAAELLLANDQASINQFGAELSHSWGRNWSSEIGVHQETFWGNGSNSNNNNINYGESIGIATEYHFSDRFALGPGYRFYDSRSTAPGQPDAETQWPFVKASWQAMRNLYLEGMVGVLISHVQGDSRQAVNPGGWGLLEYNLQRARLKLYGGQEPLLVSGLNGAGGITRFVRGAITYDFTQRLTGNVGAGFDELQANGQGIQQDAQLISWGVGLTDRVNKWLEAYVRFTQLRRKLTNSRQFLFTGSQYGREGTGNYIVVGFNVSAEAFRWSWQ
ncbi:hypothetical protein [Candidatus Binatus sp.]|uniref:hypothetical protein n=1 Tax=Candidatus Binatus sp. TaxID=2811406 RepID=UPI002F95F125